MDYLESFIGSSKNTVIKGGMAKKEPRNMHMIILGEEVVSGRVSHQQPIVNYHPDLHRSAKSHLPEAACAEYCEPQIQFRNLII